MFTPWDSLDAAMDVPGEEMRPPISSLFDWGS
jgi:hypothetical protein